MENLQRASGIISFVSTGNTFSRQSLDKFAYESLDMFEELHISVNRAG